MIKYTVKNIVEEFQAILYGEGIIYENSQA